MGDDPREVLGIDGDVLVVHPADRLLIRLAGKVTIEHAHRVVSALEKVFGPGRSVVLAEDATVIVERASP